MPIEALPFFTGFVLLLGIMVGGFIKDSEVKEDE